MSIQKHNVVPESREVSEHPHWARHWSDAVRERSVYIDGYDENDEPIIRRIPPCAKLVADALASHWNAKTGQLNPSMETLARDTGLAPGTVRKGVGVLRKMRVIETSRPSRGTSLRYRLLVSRSVTGVTVRSSDLTTKNMPKERHDCDGSSVMAVTVGTVTPVTQNDESERRRNNDEGVCVCIENDRDDDAADEVRRPTPEQLFEWHAELYGRVLHKRPERSRAALRASRELVRHVPHEVLSSVFPWALRQSNEFVARRVTRLDWAWMSWAEIVSVYVATQERKCRCPECREWSTVGQIEDAGVCEDCE